MIEVNWKDEVLEGDARYRIRDNGGTILQDNVQLEQITPTVQEQTELNKVHLEIPIGRIVTVGSPQEDDRYLLCDGSQWFDTDDYEGTAGMFPKHGGMASSPVNFHLTSNIIKFNNKYLAFNGHDLYESTDLDNWTYKTTVGDNTLTINMNNIYNFGNKVYTFFQHLVSTTSGDRYRWYMYASEDLINWSEVEAYGNSSSSSVDARFTMAMNGDKAIIGGTIYARSVIYYTIDGGLTWQAYYSREQSLNLSGKDVRYYNGKFYWTSYKSSTNGLQLLYIDEEHLGEEPTSQYFGAFNPKPLEYGNLYITTDGKFVLARYSGPHWNERDYAIADTLEELIALGTYNLANLFPANYDGIIVEINNHLLVTSRGIYGSSSSTIVQNSYIDFIINNNYKTSYNSAENGFRADRVKWIKDDFPQSIGQITMEIYMLQRQVM